MFLFLGYAVSIDLRSCEYDDETPEYWVNTRTEGALKREDMERLSRKRTHDQEVEADDATTSHLDFTTGGFPDCLGRPGPLEVEGDSRKTVTCMHWYEPTKPCQNPLYRLANFI